MALSAIVVEDSCNVKVLGGEHYDDFEESKEEVIEHSRCANWSVINENECYCLDCSQEMESELCERERDRINKSGCAYQEADK